MRIERESIVDDEYLKKKKKGAPLLIPLRNTVGTIVTAYNCGGTIPNTKEYTGNICIG